MTANQHPANGSISERRAADDPDEMIIINDTQKSLQDIFAFHVFICAAARRVHRQLAKNKKKSNDDAAGK